MNITLFNHNIKSLIIHYYYRIKYNNVMNELINNIHTLDISESRHLFEIKQKKYTYTYDYIDVDKNNDLYVFKEIENDAITISSERSITKNIYYVSISQIDKPSDDEEFTLNYEDLNKLFNHYKTLFSKENIDNTI